jgi:antirestriction protein ArdC
MFGDEKYAIEEFVAELTAASVCSMLGLGKLLDKNHIAYVQNWRQALREQQDIIPKVIDHIQKATNYILRYYDKVAKELHPLELPLAA